MRCQQKPIWMLDSRLDCDFSPGWGEPRGYMEIFDLTPPTHPLIHPPTPLLLGTKWVQTGTKRRGTTHPPTHEKWEL
jgi:hypothetical protein